MSFGVTDVAIAEITISSLRFSGAVEFGSRPLGVSTENSDYDFAILRANYEKLTENTQKADEVDITKHFGVRPYTGNNTLAVNVRVKGTRDTVDILILEHQKDLNTVSLSIETLKQLPIGKLMDKQYRVNKYCEALLDNGFRMSDTYKHYIRKIFVK